MFIVSSKNYHVFCQMKQHDDHVVAVFHHDGTEKEPCEIRLVPFALLARSKEEVCITFI